MICQFIDEPLKPGCHNIFYPLQLFPDSFTMSITLPYMSPNHGVCNVSELSSPPHTHTPPAPPPPTQDTVQGQAAGFPQTLCALPCWTHVGQDCWSYGLMRVSTTDQLSSPSLISSLWTNLESKSRRPHIFEGQCQVMSQVFRPKSMSSLIFELKSESSLLRAVPSPVSSPLSHVEVNSLKVKYQVKSFLWSCQVWSLNSSPSQFSTLWG